MQIETTTIGNRLISIVYRCRCGRKIGRSKIETHGEKFCSRKCQKSIRVNLGKLMKGGK
jgi:hypothetical protein